MAVVHSEHSNDASSDLSVTSDVGTPRTSPVGPRHRWYLPIKSLSDIMCGFLLLLLTSPVILLGVLLVKLSSKGPAFYCQTRCGKNGETFKVIKLRTMIQNAESQTGAVWSQINDSRITRVGRFLRDSHIDEFPQLINVLLGQMSLVGPRPERPEFVSQFEFDLPVYRNRMDVRPGITGLSQLQLPADSDLESVRIKLLHDLYYIRNASPWLDCRILLFTGWLFGMTFVTAAWKWIRMPD